MTIIGRFTSDAVVNILPDERKVVNFSITVNDSYRPKRSSERVKTTAYYHCGYWISDKVAALLKKVHYWRSPAVFMYNPMLAGMERPKRR